MTNDTAHDTADEMGPDTAGKVTTETIPAQPSGAALTSAPGTAGGSPVLPTLVPRTGWFAVRRADVALICQEFGGDASRAATAQAVLGALLSVASSRRVARFSVNQGLLASLSGVSSDTVGRRLADLEHLGLVALVRHPLGRSRASVIEYEIVGGLPQNSEAPAPCGNQPQPAVSHPSAPCGKYPHGGRVKLRHCMEKGKETVETGPAQARFTPPTVEEVAAYCHARQNGVNPQHWLDHYQSNGWKVGRNPMKDWRAAVRTWELNSKTKLASRPTGVQL